MEHSLSVPPSPHTECALWPRRLRVKDLRPPKAAARSAVLDVEAARATLTPEGRGESLGGDLTHPATCAVSAARLRPLPLAVRDS